jgi:hypothetical protein
MITDSWTKQKMMQSLKNGFSGLLFMLSASGSLASSENALTDLQLKMQIETVSRQSMPESCDSPYKDVSGFNVFFDSAIFVIASEKGADEKGVSDLFAVSELQKKMHELFPNVAEESPIDRLVVAQLCKFREIYKSKNTGQPDSYVVIGSDDPLLQRHLLKIGTQLFIDSREIMVTALAAHARTEANRARIHLTIDRVETARARGRNKLDGLFKAFR